MNFFTGFSKGFGNCIKAFGIIFNKGLWPFLIYPLVIWIVLYILTTLGLVMFADWLSGWLNSFFSFSSIPDSGHWLSFAKPFLTNWLGVILAVVMKIFFWYISGFFTKYILLIVLSPVFAVLSEKTEEKLTGRKFPFSFLQLIKDILRGVLITVRNLSLEFMIIVLCTIITFIFAPLSVITVPLLMFVSWYFTGFTMLDYSAERHRLKAGESADLVRKNKGYACGIGCVYWLFMILPFAFGDVVGIMFGPAVAVVGATVSFLEIKKIYFSS